MMKIALTGDQHPRYELAVSQAMLADLVRDLPSKTGKYSMREEDEDLLVYPDHRGYAFVERGDHMLLQQSSAKAKKNRREQFGRTEVVGNSAILQKEQNRLRLKLGEMQLRPKRKYEKRAPEEKAPNADDPRPDPMSAEDLQELGSVEVKSALGREVTVALPAHGYSEDGISRLVDILNSIKEAEPQALMFRLTDDGYLEFGVHKTTWFRFKEEGA